MSMFVYHRQTRAWHRRWYRGCIFMSSGHDGHRISCLSPLRSADNITCQVRNTQITHTKKPHIHNILQERKYGQLVWINTTLKSTTNYWASRYLQVIHVSPLFWAQSHSTVIYGLFLGAFPWALIDRPVHSLTMQQSTCNYAFYVYASYCDQHHTEVSNSIWDLINYELLTVLSK